MCRWAPVSAAGPEPCKQAVGQFAASPCGAQASLEQPVAAASFRLRVRKDGQAFPQRLQEQPEQLALRAPVLQQPVLPEPLRRALQQQLQPQVREPTAWPEPLWLKLQAEPQPELSPDAFPRCEAALPWRLLWAALRPQCPETVQPRPRALHPRANLQAPWQPPVRLADAMQ